MVEYLEVNNLTIIIIVENTYIIHTKYILLSENKN